MRVVAIYKEMSDMGREVEEWIWEFEKRSGIKIEKINPETREGEDFCGMRGIMEYPAIVICEMDGAVRMDWSGKQLPQIDDVMSYCVI